MGSNVGVSYVLTFRKSSKCKGFSWGFLSSLRMDETEGVALCSDLIPLKVLVYEVVFLFNFTLGLYLKWLQTPVMKFELSTYISSVYLSLSKL